MNSSLHRVEETWHVKGHVLGIKFVDGAVFEMDFGPMIDGRHDRLHGPLHDVEYFKRVYINGLTLEWPSGLDVCPDALRSWCEAGRVISKDEPFSTTLATN